MPLPSAPATGIMRDFELDDDFWPGALSALRREDPGWELRERWSACADLVDDLVADARQEPLLVGFRLATHGRNPRLFAVLIGALLARSGVSTLLLDLSPDTRWLEQLLGGDYKEGFLDHLRFGMPLGGCIRETGLDGLAVMSGGAWFLAGSPLDDAPGFRAGLDGLRRRYHAVLVTLPPPLEAGDRTGIAALCSALVTIEERGAPAPIAGSERAIVRLKGNPDAARDLALLTHRFLGPLPVALGGRVAPRRGEEPRAEALHAPAPAADDPAAAEDVAFLAAFKREGERRPPSERRRPAAAPPEPAFLAGTPRKRPTPAAIPRHGTSPDEVPGQPSRPRRRSPPRRALSLAGVAVGVVIIAVAGARGVAEDVVRGIVGESDRPYAEPEGQTIALDPVASSGADLLPVDTAGDSPYAVAADSSAPADSMALPGSALEDEQALLAGGAGRPAPFSVHVGSYQSVGSAMRVVDGVERMGYAATLAPVALPGKGRWYRVYAGAFSDSTDAAHARESLQSSDLVDAGVVRSAPWTFEIGSYPSAEASRAAAAALRQKGIVAYAVGENPVRLYAGAYQSREEAELLARTLASALGPDHNVRLTRREE